MWSTVKLGDICKIHNGDTPKTSQAEYWGTELPWLTPKDMGKLKERSVSKTARQITKEGLNNSSARLLPPQSVILSSRAPIGHVAINTVSMSFSNGCKGLVPGSEVMPEYLYYFLLLSKQLLNDLGSGTTFKGISSKTLSSVELKLPPLLEQQCIVDKLDMAFAKIDKAISVAGRKQVQADKLKQSILAGELYADDDTSWQMVKLGDICKIHNGDTPKTSQAEYWGTELPWLTPKDMGKLKERSVSKTARQITKEGLNNSSARLLPPQSVILSSRAPIGHVAINTVSMSFSNGCKGLVPGSEVMPEYLYYFLLLSKQLLNDLGRGTTFKEISSKTLSSVELNLPPLLEQQCIVDKLDAAVAETANLVETTSKQIANYQALKSAILSRELQSEAV